MRKESVNSVFKNVAIIIIIKNEKNLHNIQASNSPAAIMLDPLIYLCMCAYLMLQKNSELDDNPDSDVQLLTLMEAFNRVNITEGIESSRRFFR